MPEPGGGGAHAVSRADHPYGVALSDQERGDDEVAQLRLARPLATALRRP